MMRDVRERERGAEAAGGGERESCDVAGCG
jgi:hypothetical protein